MTEIQSVIVVDEDENSRTGLARLVAQKPELADVLRICGPEALTGVSDSKILLLAGLETPQALLRAVSPEFILKKPVRPGAVLDRAKTLRDRQTRTAESRSLPIGPYMLDPVLNLLQDAGDGPAVRLTDKEKELLVLLHARGGEPIEREALLQQVWGYGRSIETHTLETHIYRLRQKIEADPARPVLLLTDERGYFLSC